MVRINVKAKKTRKETKQFQKRCLKDLKEILSKMSNNTEDVEIKEEWIAFGGKVLRGMSSPRIDLAIGPFSEGTKHLSEYYELREDPIISKFLEKVKKCHFENLKRHNIPKNLNKDFSTWDNIEDCKSINKNARCFIAIEIEGRNDRKVVLADIINTSAIGHLGIIVATDEVLRIFDRLLYCRWFMKETKMFNFSVGNVFILSKEQFKEILTNQKQHTTITTRTINNPTLTSSNSG